jgi:hypothetical protein
MRTRKIKVYFFKANGKFYTEEMVTARPALSGHELSTFNADLLAHLDGRLKTMTAVVIKAPWGFPALFQL